MKIPSHLKLNPVQLPLLHYFFVILIRIVEVKAALEPVDRAAFGVLPHSELLAVFFLVPGRSFGEWIARIPNIEQSYHSRRVKDGSQPGVVGVEPRVISALLQSAEKALAHRTQIVLAE